jgi:hypothetical protein
VRKCAEIALRCVDKDREKRPRIQDIVQELEELEAEIKKMSLTSVLSKDLAVQVCVKLLFTLLSFCNFCWHVGHNS